jgi:MazG family protein
MDNSSYGAAAAEFDKLVRLVARLRAPGGCPWDREQTHETLKPMMIEEAYEAVEAIDQADDEEFKGELGDLLLQVVFHSQIAAEERRFAIAEVLQTVAAKMIRRHPHVFGDDRAETADDVLRSWEAIKSAERALKGKGSAPGASMLDSVSRGLPAVMEAYQITTKASRVGFDWTSASSVLEKLDEETAELKQALNQVSPKHSEISEEIGDLLFVMVNLSRLLGVDPESALKSSNRKFRKRFLYIEQRLGEDGRTPAESTLEEMDALWEEAKRAERGRV